MKHLRDTEFVDALDGHLPGDRERHLAACAGCRQRVEELRSVVDAARTSVPEPSPLFWDHFSGRVRARLDADPAGRWPAWLSPALAFRSAAVLAALVLALGLWRAAPWAPEPARPEEPAVAVTRPAGEPDDDADDPSWAEVRAAAEHLEWDDVQATGMTARPGTVERAVLTLTDKEREELQRLLQDELKRGAD